MADQSTKQYGKNLNRKWKIGAEHSLYSKDGTWYHQLTSFPGALLDANGYILFATEQDYRHCAFLRIKQDVWVPAGIAKIPGYVRVQPADDVRDRRRSWLNRKLLDNSCRSFLISICSTSQPGKAV